MSKGVWLPVVLAGLLTEGCRVEEYNVAIKNAGSRALDHGRLSYGQFEFIGGVLSPGIWKLCLLPDHPIPEKARVEWRTEDGVLHRREVEVRKLVPKGFRGDIVFEIDDTNNVTVRIVPREPGQY